jgi:hypothetical protein
MDACKYMPSLTGDYILLKTKHYSLGDGDQGWDSPNSYQDFIRISFPVSTACLFST